MNFRQWLQLEEEDKKKKKKKKKHFVKKLKKDAYAAMPSTMGDASFGFN